MDDAKIFNAKSAAISSANKCPDKRGFTVEPVKVTLLDDDAWQDISTAPMDRTEIVGYVGEGGYPGGWVMMEYCKGDDDFLAWRDWDNYIWHPTHWYPITPRQES